MNHCDNCKYLIDVFGIYVQCMKTRKFIAYEYWSNIEVEDCPLENEPPEEEA